MSSDLLADLHSQNAFQLGEFTLKSGVLSPIYVDLRTLVSSPKILAVAARAICEKIKTNNLAYDYVVGVPYGAMALATLVSHFLDKPMIFKRKEAKSYGQKKLIEGVFEVGKTALIIEDVVTSGASILETVQELRKVGLICEQAVCVLNREQGGQDRLRSENITMHSIISMSTILDYLKNIGVITEEQLTKIQHELRNPRKAEAPEVRKSAPPQTGLYCCEAHRDGGLAPGGECRRLAADSNVLDWSLEKRQSLFAKNFFNKRLVEIILAKKTNLCLAADFTSTEKILSLLDRVHPFICALKLHYDIIHGFDAQFAEKLCQLSVTHNFVIFEDRKFADIGKVTELQATTVAKWADIVTVHSVAGAPSLEPLKNVIGKDGSKLSGCLLVAELSTEKNLTTCKGYAEGTIEIAKAYPTLVSGFICQKRCHNDPSFIYWTPGVNLSATSDGAGQQWRSVERAISEDGCDIIIVGRGVCSAEDPAEEAQRYAQAGWQALDRRSTQ